MLAAFYMTAEMFTRRRNIILLVIYWQYMQMRFMLEKWPRLVAEYDPTSAQRRVVVLGRVQSPPKCMSIENLGQALEDRLLLKRQHEEPHAF